MDTELQFDQVQQPTSSACSACQGTLRGSYFQGNGQLLCEGCAESVRNVFQNKSGGFGRFVKASALGIGGGLAGGAVYTAVLALAQINAALVTILIGWLVGRGVSRGCGARGGVGYQLLAVAITYFTIGFSATLADVLTSNIAEGSIFNGIIICILGTLIGAVFMATTSILGAIITLVGLYQAWQLNKKLEIAITGPHALAPTTQTAATESPSLSENVPALPQSA